MKWVTRGAAVAVVPYFLLQSIPRILGWAPAGYIDLKKLNVFESPFNRGALQSAIDVDNPDLSNLIYVPNRNLMDLGNDIILYEKQPTRVVPGETKLIFIPWKSCRPRLPGRIGAFSLPGEETCQLKMDPATIGLYQRLKARHVFRRCNPSEIQHSRDHIGTTPRSQLEFPKSFVI